jgi:hypothetical protein
MHEEARAHFRRSLVIAVQELEPGSEDYWSIQAAAHHGIGDTEQGAGNFTQSIISYEMSIKAFEHIQDKSESRLSTVRANLGFSLLLDEKPRAAEMILEQAWWSKSRASTADEISSSPR